MIQEYGLKDDLPFNEYLSSNAYSTSFLKKVLKSPKHAKWELDNPNETGAPTAAMKTGTMVHTFLLEPNKFEEEYAVARNDDKRTKLYKQEVLDNPGKTMITMKEFRMLCDMGHSIESNPAARELLSGGRAEVSMLWEEKEYGFDMRGRIDYLQSEHIIVDLKTTQDPAPRNFDFDARFKFNYNMQAYLYTRGYTNLIGVVPEFYFVCLESSPPYDVVVRKCDKFFIDEGGEYATKAMQELADSISTGIWPGNGDDGVVTLSASEFWFKKHLVEKEKKNA